MYKKHVFVCENVRNSSAKKSCGKMGSLIKIQLKRDIKKKKLNSEMRINRSGCLGKCSQGPCVVVYPEGKWYFDVKLEECDKIIQNLVSD